jgi:hypothetical protein
MPPASKNLVNRTWYRRERNSAPDTTRYSLLPRAVAVWIRHRYVRWMCGRARLSSDVSEGVGRYPPGGTGDASREAVDQMVVPKAA